MSTMVESSSAARRRAGGGRRPDDSAVRSSRRAGDVSEGALARGRGPGRASRRTAPTQVRAASGSCVGDAADVGRMWSQSEPSRRAILDSAGCNGRAGRVSHRRRRGRPRHRPAPAPRADDPDTDSDAQHRHATGARSYATLAIATRSAHPARGEYDRSGIAISVARSRAGGRRQTSCLPNWPRCSVDQPRGGFQEQSSDIQTTPRIPRRARRFEQIYPIAPASSAARATTWSATALSAEVSCRLRPSSTRSSSARMRAATTRSVASLQACNKADGPGVVASRANNGDGPRCCKRATSGDGPRCRKRAARGVRTSLLRSGGRSQARISSPCSPSAGGGRWTSVSPRRGERAVRTPPVSSTGSRPSDSAKAYASATSLTGPTGTPAPRSRASASGSRRARVRGSRASSSRCASRARVGREALVVSPARARRSPSHSRANIASLPQATASVRRTSRTARSTGGGCPCRPGTTPALSHAAGLVEQRGERAVHQRDLDALALPPRARSAASTPIVA